MSLSQDFAIRWKPEKLLARAAKRSREKSERKTTEESVDWTLPVVELVTAVLPGYSEPRHLVRYCEILDAAIAKFSTRSNCSDLVTVAAPPQHGKALANETPVLTSRGWLKVGEVRVGDLLVGSDGYWTPVLAVYPQGEKQLYRVEFSEGKSNKKTVGPSVETCGSHLWQVHNRYSGIATIKSTEQLIGDIEESDGRRKWRIPTVLPGEGPQFDLPVDPYLLGCWLGDGTTACGQITTMDDPIRAAFASRYKQGASNNDNTGMATTYNFWGLIFDLKKCGVVGNKHIPQQYLEAGVTVRLGVLQGLCDTDGTVAKNGSQQSYCSTRKVLADGFMGLVWSLGGTCSVSVKKTTGLDAYNVWFRLPRGMKAFRLERKGSLLNADSARNAPRRFVSKITRSRVADCTCFTVAAEDGLFCVGREFIVTHNTTCTYIALLKAIMVGRGMRHMYVSYSQTRTDSVAKTVRRLAESLGIVIEGGINSWYIPTTQSTIIWTSIGGVGSGEPVTGILVVDDPFKDFAQARSPAFREQVRSWMVGVGLRRIHTTTTVVEMATRWHEEDLTAWMIEQMAAPYINIQGICEDEDDGTERKIGDPLFPELHPIEMLEMQRQAQPQEFEAQYQGRPRAMGDALFDEPARYTELPKGAFSTAYGVDLAYSEATISDWSVCLKGRRYGNSIYLNSCYRRQLDANKVVPALRATWQSERAPMRWYYGGAGEKGMVSFLQAEIPNFVGIAAKSDKVIRSTNARSGWNLLRVLLPSEDSPFYGPWVEEVRKECMTFSGAGDAHDDIVDALAALVDQLMGASYNWEMVDGMNDALHSKRRPRGVANEGGWSRR